MYSCGYRDLAHLLAEMQLHNHGLLHHSHAELLSSDETKAPSFALPGDLARYAPDRPADVRHIAINVELDFAQAMVIGDVTTHFAALYEQVQEVSFDAAELAIEQVTLAHDGETPLSHWSEGEKLHVRLDRSYAHGETFSVRVRYRATPRTGLVFVKPVEGNSELPEQVWTQGETEYHHFWFPCHDFPNDRATTTLRATVPARFFALSNGALQGVQDNDGGTRTYTWHQAVPFPAYLVTLVVGEFAEMRDTWREVPVTYYVPTGREEDGRRMLGNTPAMIEYYSQHFGLDYPYVKYAQVVAELFLGAMENVSATTHSYRLLPDARASLDWTPESTVAHELVHQWFGDLIAVRDWSQTWLKESFATYFATTWYEHSKGLDEASSERLDDLRAYLDADTRGRRPIVYNVYRKNGFELFDRHTYQKGSLVLHMLRHTLGDEPFWRAIQHYARRNREREVITADFERAVEEATGRSMARFFEQWVYKAGHPQFKVSYSWDDALKMAKVTVAQTQKVSATTPLFVTPVDLGFLVPDADGANADDLQVALSLVNVRVEVAEEKQTFYIPLARRPFSVRFDQGGWLIKTLDFERPTEMLRVQLRHDPDVLGRIEAAEALGKLHDDQSVAALEAALVAEPFWAVRGAIAEALASQKSERALHALTAALEQIDEPKARRAIVTGLGAFRAPEQAALAERAAATLRALLERGDPSYHVEAAAAVALGKTRTPGAYEFLLARVDTPSWMEVLRGGIFGGLGELGDPRAVDVLTTWLLDRSKPMDARSKAAAGLWALARTKRVDPGEAQTRAVDALIAALDDPWEVVVRVAAAALDAWGDARAIPALERASTRAVDEHIVRGMREAVLTLQRGHSASAESRTLRSDLETVREENRKLRERLQAIEARLDQTPASASDK